MISNIQPDDIYWAMDWTQFNESNPLHKKSPDIELIFENHNALAILLINEVVSINSFWWEKSWPNNAKNAIGIFVNCSDIFAWGSSDAEQLLYNDIQDLYDHYIKDPIFGPAVWCIKKRSQLPQKPVYNDIMKQNIWNLDELNLNE
jgi:hypothetical protein